MPDARPEMQSVTMMPGGTVEKWKCFEVPNGTGCADEHGAGAREIFIADVSQIGISGYINIMGANPWDTYTTAQPKA